MKIRIMGTPEECETFKKLIIATVPKQYIRSISGFYANRRNNEYSNEGRIYCEFKDLPVGALKLKGVQ